MSSNAGCKRFMARVLACHTTTSSWLLVLQVNSKNLFLAMLLLLLLPKCAPPPKTNSHLAYVCVCVVLSRNLDCGLHQPHLGDQNPHAVNILHLSWRIPFHDRRGAADLPFGRAAGLLSWFGPFPFRRFPWRAAVHGLRKAEDGPRRQYTGATARTWHLRPLAS